MKNKLYFEFAASCFLLFFFFLGYIVKFYTDTLQKIDQPVIEFLNDHQTNTLNHFFLWLTKFANFSSLVILGLAFAYILYTKNDIIEILWLGFNAGIVAGLGNFLLKFLFNRPRPQGNQMIEASHSSFPSGHSMASVLFYGTLILLLPLLVKNKSFRIVLQALLVLLILGIGISRVYLGVHYPTDILGGYTLGLACLLGSYPFYKKKSYIYRFQGKKV